jgi:hypothetical protein
VDHPLTHGGTENWLDAYQNIRFRLKTLTISHELSFLFVSTMGRFIQLDGLGALLACALSKTPPDRIEFATLGKLGEGMGAGRMQQSQSGLSAPGFRDNKRLCNELADERNYVNVGTTLI